MNFVDRHDSGPMDPVPTPATNDPATNDNAHTDGSSNAARNAKSQQLGQPEMTKKAQQALEQYNKSAKEFADAVLFEKATIIAPALKRAFNRAVHYDRTFDVTKDKMLDIGCGPFLLALPFLRDKIHVDGIDIAPNMIEQAKKTMAKNSNVSMNGTKLVNSFNDLKKEDYSFAMMNFVHQCCADRAELDALFKQANEMLKDGSSLVVIGTHPHYLHAPHAACSYDVPPGKRLEDGEVYTGTIYDYQADNTFRLEGDHFWSKNTLLESARTNGFSVELVEDIDDVDSFVRTKSKEPAYLMMMFSKTPPKISGPVNTSAPNPPQV